MSRLTLGRHVHLGSYVGKDYIANLFGRSPVYVRDAHISVGHFPQDGENEQNLIFGTTNILIMKDKIRLETEWSLMVFRSSFLKEN